MSPDELAQRVKSVSLHYGFEQPLTTETPGVQQWWVRAIARDWERVDEQGEPAEEPVALINIVKGSLLDPSLWDQLDALEADLEAVASAVLDPQAGALREDVEGRLLGSGSSLLVLNSVTVGTEWRGHGLGVLLAGMALQVLSDDAVCAVTYPAPLDGSEERARARAIGKLEKVWAQLGFEPLTEGVWILDPASMTLEEAVNALKERFRIGSR